MTEHLSPEQEELIHLYLDGELSSIQRKAFVSHLQQCSTCQTRLAELETLFNRLDSLEEVEPPAGLLAETMAKLPAKTRPVWPLSFDQLALAGQFAIGVTLLVIVSPMLFSMLRSSLLYPVWPAPLEISTSLTNWLADSGLGLGRQLLAQWPPLEFSEMAPSLEVSLAIITGLGIAWLIGNGVLLQRRWLIHKNGGTQ